MVFATVALLKVVILLPLTTCVTPAVPRKATVLVPATKEPLLVKEPYIFSVVGDVNVPLITMF